MPKIYEYWGGFILGMVYLLIFTDIRYLHSADIQYLYRQIPTDIRYFVPTDIQYFTDILTLNIYRKFPNRGAGRLGKTLTLL